MLRPTCLKTADKNWRLLPSERNGYQFFRVMLRAGLSPHEELVHERRLLWRQTGSWEHTQHPTNAYSLLVSVLGAPRLQTLYSKSFGGPELPSTWPQNAQSKKLAKGQRRFWQHQTTSTSKESRNKSKTVCTTPWSYCSKKTQNAEWFLNFWPEVGILDIPSWPSIQLLTMNPRFQVENS